MVKGYKKIDFDTLHKLVANIDYPFKDSYPVVFLVNGKKFSCGIETAKEQQYLIDEDSNILDFQEPDDMVFDEIGRMLREKCNIHEGMHNTITLATPLSFDGTKPNLNKEIRKYKNALAREEKRKAKLLKPMELVKFASKEEGLQTVYNKVLKKAGRPFGCSVVTNYYRVDPKPVNLDDGNVLNVEWLQPSSFNTDVLINWKTDRVKASSLSKEELEQLAAIV